MFGATIGVIVKSLCYVVNRLLVVREMKCSVQLVDMYYDCIGIVGAQQCSLI